MKILNESKRDDLLIPCLNILKEKGINCTLGELKKFLLRKFVEEGDMRNLSLGSNFYLAGVARYYFNGDLTLNKDLSIFKENPTVPDTWNTEICTKLNALILILRNSVIDSVGEKFEQPEDFGTLSIEKLLRKYNKKISEELGIEIVKPEKADNIDRNKTVGNGYTFDILYNFESATKYYQATKPGAWCITYGQQHYNSYIRMLGIHYVIFRKDGWENIERKKGPNWSYSKPQDEYGCSLIALLQSNQTGEPVYITSRWNHGSGSDNSNCEANHAFTKEEFMKKTGVTDADLQRIFSIWKKDKPIKKATNTEDKKDKLKALRFLKYAQMRINGGENPDNALIQIPRDLAQEDKEYYINNRKSLIIGNGKLNKSVFRYRFEIDGKDYLVLSDRGKILFQSMIEGNKFMSSTSWGSYVCPNSGSFRWLNNVIVISYNQDTYSLYNLRTREFISVDGITKFKYIRSTREFWDDTKVKFYQVALSGRQSALIDANTNIPLKLPNGNSWFEEFYFPGKYKNYSRQIRPVLVPEDVKQIAFTYDSSSREGYIYDVKNKKFIQIGFAASGDYEIVEDKLNSQFFGENSLLIKCSGYPSAYAIYNDGKKMAIGGYSTFEYFRRLRDEFIEIEPYSADGSTELRMLWNPILKSFLLDDQNKPLLYKWTSTPHYNIKSEYTYFSLNTDKAVLYNSDKRYCFGIFDNVRNVMLINPENNTINFMIGKYNYEHHFNVPISGEETSIIKMADGKQYKYEDLIQNGYYKKAFMENSAPYTVADDNESNINQTNDNTINENTTLNNSDITIMVEKIIDKVLNNNTYDN